MTFRRIAILGPGLLGGSIALALKKRFSDVAVTGWARRQEAAEEMRKLGAADFSSTKVSEVVAGADLVVLCTPIGAMPELAERLRPHLSEGALVTDVGSVKAVVVDALRPILGNAFVGSHPMAGSDQAGISAARADLFEGAACIVSADPGSEAESVQKIEAFWTALGACVCRLSPAEHDRLIGWISHLPHLLAASLVNLVCSAEADALKYCGSGFRDTTRVASGPAGMWAEIFDENGPALKHTLRAMIEHLQHVEQMLGDKAKMENYLAAAKAARDRLKLPIPHGALEN